MGKEPPILLQWLVEQQDFIYKVLHNGLTADVQFPSFERPDGNDVSDQIILNKWAGRKFTDTNN